MSKGKWISGPNRLFSRGRAAKKPESSILSELAWLLGIGIGAGASASLLLGLLIEAQLYGIESRDPWIIAGAVTLMAVVALVAGFAPTMRAIHVEPLQALRHE
jgi:ABC-type lipoprotein release transport system permease subunit